MGRMTWVWLASRSVSRFVEAVKVYCPLHIAADSKSGGCGRFHAVSQRWF
jgi:hypothetical protein